MDVDVSVTRSNWQTKRMYIGSQGKALNGKYKGLHKIVPPHYKCVVTGIVYDPLVRGVSEVAS
jgi:hypothetical protein